MKKRDDNRNYLSVYLFILVLIVLFVNIKSVNAQCTPNIVNGTFSEWKDISDCNENGEITQRRGTVQYDSNNCGEFKDGIVEEYRTVRCEYIETSFIEALQENIFLFGLLIFLVVLLMIIVLIIFIILLRSNARNKSKNVSKIKIPEKIVKKEDKLSFSEIPKESFLTRIKKNWRLYLKKRIRLKEQDIIRRQQKLARQRRLELQKKERERTLELEAIKEKRRIESERRRLEFERAKIRGERIRRFKGIFSGFGEGVSDYFAERRRLREERKIKRLREIELNKKRVEEERKQLERRKINEAKRKELEIFNLIQERKERERTLELEAIKEKRRIESERRRLEFERAKIRGERIRRFKGIFSGFGEGVSDYFAERRRLREEEQRRKEQELESIRKRGEEDRRLIEEKKKGEMSKSFEEKYYPPERLALLKENRKELPEIKELEQENPVFLSKPAYNKIKQDFDIIKTELSKNQELSRPKKEQKNYLLERKIKEQQSKVIQKIIEDKKNQIGKLKQAEDKKSSKNDINKPKIITEIYSQAVKKEEIKEKPFFDNSMKNININKPKIEKEMELERKDKIIYDENKPNLSINLGMNKIINKPNTADNTKNEFYNNINNLITKGEKALDSNNLKEAEEIYEKLKSNYRPEYDQDKSLHRKIISYYYNILNLMNK